MRARCAGKRTLASYAPAQAQPTEGNPSLCHSSTSLFCNSPWDGSKQGMFAISKAKIWVDDGIKSKSKPRWVQGKMHEYVWVQGKMHEYVSAEVRNMCVCSDAVAHA